MRNREDREIGSAESDQWWDIVKVDEIKERKIKENKDR